MLSQQVFGFCMLCLPVCICFSGCWVSWFGRSCAAVRYASVILASYSCPHQPDEPVRDAIVLCRYYLRSLGADPRKEPSDIRVAFPAMAADLCLPQLPNPEAFFSSVLRISSGGSLIMCIIRSLKSFRQWLHALLAIQ